MKTNKQYMIEYADFKILSDLAKKNYSVSSISELNLIFSKVKAIIDRPDLDRLTELIRPTLDVADISILDGIASKYSINKLINEYKVKLWNEVKRHKIGTVENQQAHFEYIGFSEYIKLLDFDSDKITYDIIADIINKRLYLDN